MRTEPLYHVACYVDGRQSFYHLSKIHAGLLILQDEGQIALRFQSTRPLVGWKDSHPWTAWLQVTDLQSGDSCRAAFDLDDRTEVFNETALRNCDVYFKRNVLGVDVERLPTELRMRVKPFGLNFACRVPGQRRRVLRRAVPGLFGHTSLSPLREARSLRKRFQDMKSFARALPVMAYEQRPTSAIEPVVFFQTRVWWEPQRPGVRNIEEEVNQPRVELVRTLRRELGRRFVGGLAPTVFACENFPDLLSPVSSLRREYVDAGKRMLVGIASQPCVKTGSFKLGEYLAASRCIVSYTMSNLFARPMTEGVNYLRFQTPNECVRQCVMLLDDPNGAERMRRSNWEYYQQEVAPGAHMKNVLRRCFCGDA
jgi:hypothetical protein